MARTYLIAAAELLTALRQHEDLGTANAFADSDALAALQAIARSRPEVIALEKMFASSTRGAAFINRVKSDPALAHCRIRIVEDDGRTGRVPAPSEAAIDNVEIVAAVEQHAHLPGIGDRGGPAAAAALPAAETTSVPVPQAHAEGTAKAQRTEVIIDGNVGSLVDASAEGAWIISPSSLRPNQRVRISLAEDDRSARVHAVVESVTFEMPKGGARYRARVRFADGAHDAVARLVAAVSR